ncbi:hypothetical protein Nepgr_004309 [Nepenthes gracilis]|uniref:Uncharacterized protein n=1 Tax=Nepenthes gracilis TaxID=150966 RepID=A0AAD3S139_NEPGR|nr:hypothetical protein Nepgr_004309 [Nepenthes gracilis]
MSWVKICFGSFYNQLQKQHVDLHELLLGGFIFKSSSQFNSGQTWKVIHECLHLQRVSLLYYYTSSGNCTRKSLLWKLQLKQNKFY